MGHSVIEFFKNLLGPQMNELLVFLCSMLPVVELRGAVPLGISLGMDPVVTFIIAFLGNMLPIPFILLFVSSVLKWMKKKKLFKKIVDFIENKAQKAATKYENLTFWGLAFFVAIPLPGTGGWTGALLADFMGMKFKKALLSISLGVFIADIVVIIVTLFFAKSLGFLLG